MKTDFIHKPSGKPLEDMKAFVRRNDKIVETTDSLVSHNGEINATSTQDLLSRIQALGALFSRGDMGMALNGYYGEPVGTLGGSILEFWKRWLDNFQFNEQKAIILGQLLSTAIQEFTARSSLSTRCLSGSSLHIANREVRSLLVLTAKPGGKYEVKETGPLEAGTPILTDPVRGRTTINIPCANSYSAKALMLTMKYHLQTFMRGPDLQFLSLLRKAGPMGDDGSRASASYSWLSGMKVMEMRSYLEKKSLPAYELLVSLDGFNDLCADPDFNTMFKPCSHLALLLEGRIGHYMGMSVSSDFLRLSNHQVLADDECFVTGPHNITGELCQEGPRAPEFWKNSLYSTDSYDIRIGYEQSMFVDPEGAVCARRIP